jgi:hypothetical protein
MRAGGPVKVAQFNSGGPVGATAGSNSSLNNDDLTRAFTQFAQAATIYASTSTELAQSFTRFSTDAAALTEALSNFPRTINFTGQWNGTLVINGGEFLTKINPELQRMVTEGINNKINEVFKTYMPEAGVKL